MQLKRHMNHGKQTLFFAILTLMCFQSAIAQQGILDSIRGKFDAYRTHTLHEKLYVHLDRSFYYSGETMWFKIYVVDGTLHKPLDISSVAYLEIIDLTNRAVLQTKVELKEGRGNGALFLPSSLSSGNYQVRAYTRWMKNFDPEFYFHQPISILNTLRKPETESVSKAASIDLQFFPEGGNLVNGLKSKVAFRATNDKGEGIQFKGAVVNASNDTIVKFQQEKFGIGHFIFTPSESQVYKAVIKDAQGKTATYPLPTINNFGYILSLKDSSEWISLAAEAKLPEAESDVVYLLVQARNQIATSVMGRLVRGKIVFPVDKKQLGNGINHFTLFNAKGRPVCERLYFKRPEENLIINTTSDRQEYDRRRKIVLTFDAKSTKGNALPADLSVAVYRKDSLQTIQHTNISQYLWLTSELHGAIESPAYYLENNDAAANQAMDNLMLTHGWSRFIWGDILSGVTPQRSFLPEPRGFVLTGSVINIISNAPAPFINTYLSVPGKNVRLYTARSGQQGQVMYQMRDFFEINKIVMQSNTQQDSIYKFEIDNPFSQRYTKVRLPDFTIAASAKSKILSGSIHAQAQTIFYADSLRFTKSSTDTVAFYGKPYKRYFLDDYTRFTSMEDVLREYVGPVWLHKNDGKIHFWVLDDLNGTVFRDHSLVLLDGVPVFQEEKILAFDPLKVKTLDIIARKYYFGSDTFNGIMSYTTANGDLGNFSLDTRSLVQNFEGLQREREFYSPRYESISDRNNRLPDFRDLLFWAPEVKPDTGGKYTVEFYSSDETGKYEIVVQGLTKDGLPGSATATFEVKDLSN